MTTDIRFGERELQAAAKLVAESMLEGLPDAAACGHDFSEGFRRKMETLLRRQRRRSIRHTVWRYAAALLLTVTLTFGAVMAVSSQARAAVVQWVRTVYENSVVYRFFNPAPQGALPRYQLTWLPEGFTEADVFCDAEYYRAVYLNEDTGQSVVFEYSFMDDGMAIMVVPEGEHMVEQIQINGYAAEYHQMQDATATNTLVIFDSENNICLMVTANATRSDIFNIAEHIILDKMTK